jgi:hypothetical protein
MFWAPGLIFSGTEGVWSRFHILRSRTRFRRYRGRRDIFIFYAPGLVFSDTVGVGSLFHVLRPRTRFRQFRGCRVPFSCFARPNSFSSVPRVSGPVFMFCAVRLVFDGNKGVASRFMFCAPGLVFGGPEGVRSYFDVLRFRTHFRRYRGRPIPFLCFPLPDMFLAVMRASGPVFMFCAPGLIFGGTEGGGSRFHVLRYRTRFRRYRGRRVPFSSFALPDSFSAIPRALGPFFMFCAPGLIFGGTEGVGSLFHVLRSRTRFRRYRGLRVLFSCFALPDSFSTISRVSGPVFMFCAAELVFAVTEGVGSRFHVLRDRTRFRRY